MAKKFLSKGCIMSCALGSIPVPAMASRKSMTMDGLTVLTSNDKDFVKTFGLCMSTGTPKPCNPSLTTWVNFIPNISYKGGKALTTDSFIMCALGGKVSPQSVTGQRTAKLESEKIKCPLCGKNHDKHLFIIEGNGDSEGNDYTLGMNMLSTLKHPWSKPFGGKNIAAHHLICQSLVNDGTKDNIWARICKVYDYDINKKENGVYLPNKLAYACYLGVPLHYSNHGSGFGGSDFLPDKSIKPTYVNRIESELKTIKSNYTIEDDNPCPEEYKDGFIAEMDALSKKAFDNIEVFSWTLTFDAINYKPSNPIGCANKMTIREKQDELDLVQKRLTSKSEVNGYKLYKKNIKEIREVRDAMLNNYLAPCACGRIHSEYTTAGIARNQKIKYGGTY